MSLATDSTDHTVSEISGEVRTRCLFLWNPVDPTDEVDYRHLDAAFACADPAVRLCAMRRLCSQLVMFWNTSSESECRRRIICLRDSTDPALAAAAHWLTEWRFGVPGVTTTREERIQIAAAVQDALREDPSRLYTVAAIEPAYTNGSEDYPPSPVWHGVVLAMTEQPDLLERQDPAARRALAAVLEAQMCEKQPVLDAVHIAPAVLRRSLGPR